MSEFEGSVFDEAVDVTEEISKGSGVDVSAQVDKINETIKSSIPDPSAAKDFSFKAEGGKFQLEVGNKEVTFGKDKVSFGDALTSPEIEASEIADKFTQELGIKGDAAGTFSEQIRTGIEESPKRNATRAENELNQNVEEVKGGFSDSSASEQKINDVTSSDGDSTLEDEAKSNKKIKATDEKVKKGTDKMTDDQKKSFWQKVADKLGIAIEKMPSLADIAKFGLIAFFTYEFLNAHRNGKSGCFRYDNKGGSCKMLSLTCNKDWKTQYNRCSDDPPKCIQGDDKKNKDPNCPAGDANCNSGKGDCSTYCDCKFLQCNPDSKTAYQYQCQSGMSLFDSFCDVAGTIARVADDAFGTGTGLLETVLKWLKWIALIIVIALVIFVIIKLFMIIFKKKDETPSEERPVESGVQYPSAQPQMIVRQPYQQAYYQARVQGIPQPQMVGVAPQPVQRSVTPQPQMVVQPVQRSVTPQQPVFFQPQPLQRSYSPQMEIAQPLQRSVSPQMEVAPQPLQRSISPQMEVLQPPPMLEIPQSSPQFEVLQPQYDPLAVSQVPLQSRVSQSQYDPLAVSQVPLVSQPQSQLPQMISRNIQMGPVLAGGMAPSFQPVQIGGYGPQIVAGASQRFGKKKYRMSHRKF